MERRHHTTTFDSAITRRGFLAATGGLLLAAACGSGSGSGKSASNGSSRSKSVNALTLSIEPYTSTRPERLAFAIADDAGRFLGGPDTTIAVRPPGGTQGAPVPTTLHAEGLPAGRGVYVLEMPFPSAGIWGGVVQVAGHTAAPLYWQVTSTPKVPIVGAKALATPTPTVTATQGVDPLCTRQPACPLHTVSLDRALTSGKPVAVMFATPARCQSRYCGPVLDQLLAVQDAYRDRVELIHVEIYKDSTSDALVPAVDAWQLPGEPWLFGIDRTGAVVGRLDGAMGTDEVRSLLDALV
jgi:hypothetical protein